MTEKLVFNTASSDTPDGNILRGLFTCFLNTGVFDQRIAAARVQAKSKRSDHIGEWLVAELREPLRDEFLAWVESNPVAEFMFTKYAREMFARHFKKTKDPWEGNSALDTILGEKYKLLTNYARTSLPRDLKKSFYTKAFNRLVKFCEEYRSLDAEQGWGVRSIHDGNQWVEKPIEWWLRLALKPKHTAADQTIGSENLRQIRQLYLKMMKHEDLEDVVQELKQQAVVAGVMLS